MCGACSIALDVPFRHRCRVAGHDERADRADATDRIIDDEFLFHRDRACPECGSSPARSVSSRRMLPDLLAAICGWALCALLGLAVAALMMNGEMVGISLSVIAAGAALQLLAHLAVARYHTSRASLRSKASTASLKPTVVPDGRHGRFDLSVWPTRSIPAYLLIATAMIASATAAFHFANSGIVNPEAQPGVVAPGTEVRVRLKGTITSLGGAWSGRADARIIDDADRRPKVGAIVPTLESLEARSFTTKDTEQKFHPEVRILIPDDTALGGRELMIEVRVLPVVVVLVRNSCSLEVKGEIVERIAVRVAPRPAADFYKLVIRTGSILAAILASAAAVQFYRVDRRLGQFPLPDVYVTKILSDEARLQEGFSWKEHRARQNPPPT